MRARHLCVLSTLISLFLAPPLAAQDAHVADEAALTEALTDRAASDAADREQVRRVLRREEVRAVAEEMGVDLERAEGALSTTEGRDLRRLARSAREVEEHLAMPQDVVTFPVMWIVIGLLVLIVLILVL